MRLLLQWVDDAVLALDAAGLRQAAVIGDAEGGPMAIMLAATFPDRVSALALVNTFARWRRAADYPIGMPDATVGKLVSLYEHHWARILECWRSRRRASRPTPTCRNGSCASSGSRCRQARRRECTGGC